MPIEFARSGSVRVERGDGPGRTKSDYTLPAGYVLDILSGQISDCRLPVLDYRLPDFSPLMRVHAASYQ
jgi:hypothetical protein